MREVIALLDFFIIIVFGFDEFIGKEEDITLVLNFAKNFSTVMVVDEGFILVLG